VLEHATYTTNVGKHLLMATARLQLCAGWLAFDAGRHDVAQASYTDALTLARQTDDPEVEIRAFSLLALRSNILGRPREARRLALAAAQIKPPTNGSPLLTVIPQLRQAVASSLMADIREADHAITKARRALERDHKGPVEQWCAFLNPMEIDAVEATCALETDRPSRAAELLERAIAGYGSNDQYARNRAFIAYDSPMLA
jgi:tetratricopeptide (TPR) repeat protein